jgi:hypothetical protein
MGKTWVLDTSTKGTGAEMVPIEKVLRPERSERSPLRSKPLPKARLRPPKPAEPRRARRFKVVDTMTHRVIADGNVRAALRALEEVRNAVDVDVYTRRPPSTRWHPLTHGEKQTLLRARPGP